MKELDVVRLYDGRTGTILEVFENGAAFLVEITDEGGATLEITTVKSEQIADVVFSA
ncbi:MAG: DUF4926 domain-containing protein [Acutalibacteraceae bacterium]